MIQSSYDNIFTSHHITSNITFNTFQLALKLVSKIYLALMHLALAQRHCIGIYYHDTMATKYVLSMTCIFLASVEFVLYYYVCRTGGPKSQG